MKKTAAPAVLRCTLAIGNSHTTRLLWNPDGSVEADSWRKIESTPKAVAALPLRFKRGEGVLVSSVVPKLTKLVVGSLTKRGCNLSIFRQDVVPDIEIIPEPPERVGSDRIAAALGALAIDPTVPWVVADSGTAVTCNAVTPARGSKLPRFEGGLIAPGAALSLHALSKGTAQLPDIKDDGGDMQGFIGTSTEQAMQLGVAIQQIAGLMAMIEGQRAILGPETRVALAGGGGPMLYDALKRSALRHFDIVYEPYLVHRGLAAAWKAAQR
jgi:type III pantothenate kinase